MDVSSVITEFGAYYQNAGQNASRLYRLLRAQFATLMLFKLIITDDEIWRASKTTIGRLLQPFQKGWTPVPGVGFSPVEIRQYKMKMDHEEYPDDVESSWLGFLSSSNLDRKTWPFVKWLIENELLPQIKEDLELNEIYKGVYAAPTPGAAGPPSTAMNGIKKIINDYITAGRITPISTGVLETDPKLFVDQVEDFCKQINVRYRMKNMKLAMSEDRAELYQEGYDIKYNVNYNQAANNGKVRYKNIEVVGLPSHEGSNKIWCTPPENAIMMQKKTMNQDKVMLESEDRKVKIWTDFWMGIGYIFPELIFTNDQDLPVV